MRVKRILRRAKSVLEGALSFANAADTRNSLGEGAPYRLALEDRILYSAAPLPIDPGADPSATAPGGEDLALWGSGEADPFAVATESDESNITIAAVTESAFAEAPLHGDHTAQVTTEGMDAVTGSEQAASPLHRELVVIDRSVADFQTLVDDLHVEGENRQFNLLFLDSEADGVEAVTQALSGDAIYEGVHIVSHGRAGAVKIGGVWLQNGNLEAYAGDLAQWRAGLTESADLLFYGCDLASTHDGQTLIEALGALTGADVAASSDVTGHASLDADWCLEYTTGDINTGIAFNAQVQHEWLHVLAPPTAVDDSYTVVEDGSLMVDWWDSDWTRRSQIALSGNTFAGAENLTDFPILVVLNSGNIDYALTQDAGQDLRFFDADGAALAYEIESWDESGDSHVWVKVPQIDTTGTDFIQMYYGNAAASDGQDATAVWSDNGFSAVYHLNDTGAAINDSSASNYDGTNAGTTAAVGQIAGSRDFERSSSQYVSLGNNRSLIGGAAGATLSAWINRESTLGSAENLLGASVENGGSTSGLSRFALQLTGDNLTAHVRSADGARTTISTTTSPLAGLNGSWRYVSASVDVAADTVRFYVDGNLIDPSTYSAAPNFPGAAFPASPSGSASLGANEDFGSEYFDGRLDEGRFSNVIHSAAWTRAEYLTMTDGFVTVGAAEAAPVTGGVLANDSDPDSPRFEAVLVAGPSNAASLSFNPDGTFTYTPTTDFSGVDAFTYKANDGSTDSTIVTVTITVTAVNDSPEITSNGGGAAAGITVVENAAAVTTVASTDIDGGAPVYTIIGGADAAEFAIDSATGILSFVSAPDYELAADADGNNVYDVTLQVSDGAGGVDTQDLAVTVANDADTTTLYLKGDNTPPFSDLSTSPPTDVSLGNYDPGRDPFAGLVIAKGGAGANESDDTKHHTWAISGPVNVVNQPIQLIFWTDMKNGMNAPQTVDAVQGKNATVTAYLLDLPTAAAETGGTVIASVSVTDATWGDGFVWEQKTIDFGAVNYSVAAGRQLAVKLVVDSGSGDDVWFAYGTTSYTSRLVIGGGITAPTVTSNGGGATAAVTVVENNAAVTTVTATDADLPAQTLVYSIIGGADAARFAINSSTGELTFLSAPNYEAPSDTDGDNVYDVTVQVSDGEGGTDAQAIAVTVTDADEFDVVAVIDGNAATNAVHENVANGISVGITAIATDADGTANTITYSLDDDAGGRFTIDSSTGVVTVADGALLDREAAASHNIVIRASSVDGSFSTQTFTISLLDVDEFELGPVSDTNAAANAVHENAANGTTVGITALASDADATTNTIAYSLDDDAGGRFAVHSVTGVVTVADGTLLDRESAASHRITVRAISADGSTSTQTFTIDLIDVDEFDVGPVTDANASANTVDENAASGTVVGVAALASDADATANAINYNLADDAGGRFAIDSSTGVVAVANGSLLDYESAASHSITVRATSTDGSYSTLVITIAVDPVNDNDPVIVSNGGGAAASIHVAENTAAVTTVAADDADLPAQTLTYSLVGGADVAFFSIDSSTGELRFNAAPDFESPVDADGDNVYEVIVSVSDGDGGADTQVLNITVSNANVSPVLTAIELFIGEGERVVLTGANLNASDPDNAPAELTYTLSNVAGGRFELTTAPGAAIFSFTQQQVNGGQVAFVHDGGEAAPSYEATVSDGVLVDGPHSANVVFTNLNDAPAILANRITIGEGQAVALTASNFNASDPDHTPVQVAYKITNLTGGRFELWSAPGAALTTFTQQQVNNGEVVFFHDGGEAAPAFDVTVSDGALDDSPHAADIAFTNVNDLPSSADDSYAIGEDDVLGPAAATGVLANDTDAESSSLAAVLVTGPAHGDLVLNPDGSFTYTPHADFSGSDSFTYRSADGVAGGNVATVAIAVTPVNDAPTAAPEKFHVENSGVLSVAAPGLLGTAVDPEGDPLMVRLVSGPAHGVLALHADGSFVYQPDMNHSGVETFTFELLDRSGGSQSVTVEIVVQAAAAPPPPSDSGDPSPPSDSEQEDEDEENALSVSLRGVKPQAEDAATLLGGSLASSRQGPGGAAEGARIFRESSVSEELFQEAAETTSFVAWTYSGGGPARGGLHGGGRPAESPRDLESFAPLAADLQMLWSRLDTFQQEVQAELQSQTIVAGAAMFITSTAAAGYVLWSLRAGTLLAGLLSSLPAWTSVDVLAVAEASRNRRRTDQRDTLLDLVTRQKPS